MTQFPQPDDRDDRPGSTPPTTPPSAHGSDDTLNGPNHLDSPDTLDNPDILDAPAPDPWAWVDAEEDEAEVDTSALHVTAVLVTRQAGSWLPETLSALARSDRRPDRLVAVDNASTDETADLLRDAVEAGTVDRVVTGAADDGFGAAVNRALAQVDTDGLLPTAEGSQSAQEWLWLLHDDAVVAPDALTQLLRQVLRDPGIAVTGPKLLRPRRPRGARAREAEPALQLSEIGMSIAGTGRRDHGLEPGEVDQGQHDEPREVLAVSTCGLLVRREVWDQLGGLTSSLPVFRDGVDFGWRARLAGHRVVTTPAAAVVHRQVGHAGLRPDGATGRHPARLDRALGLHVVLGHARGVRRPLVAVRLVWGCLLRTLGYLIGKAPSRSVDELAALGSFLSHPARTRAVREGVRAAAPTRESARAADRLRPPWWSSLAVGVDRAGSAWAERSTDRQADRDADLGTLDAMTGDDFADSAADRGPAYRSITLGSFVVAVLLALVSARSLWRGGHLAGPGMLPAGPGGWTRWLAPIAGSPAVAPPWLGLVALLSSIVRPEPLVTGLVLGMVPLAFLGCQPLLHALTDNRRVRWWGALAWSVLPVLVGGENQARLALGVLAVTLPLLGLGLRRLLGHAGLRGAWGTGLALAVATLVVPVLYAPALVAALVGAVILLIRRERGTVGRLALALAIPLVLWAPWWVSLVRAGFGGRVLFGPAPALVAVTPPPATWALLLGRPGGAGLPPVWVSAAAVGAVWLVAVLALAVAPTRRVVLIGWGVALAAFGCAIAASRLVVSVPPLGVQARPWTGALVMLALGALVAAGVAAVPVITAAVARRGFGVVQPLTVFGGVLVVLAGLVGAGWFVWGGAAGPVHRTTLTALPPYLLTAQSQGGVRTLAITVHGSEVHWSLIGGDQLRLGDSERGYAFGGSATAGNLTDDVTRRLVGGSGDEDIAPDLARLGVAYVWVSGADQAQQTVIGATPGLAVASGTPDAQVWRLARPTGPALIVAGAQTTAVQPGPGVTPTSGSAQIPAGDADRLLVLTSPADPRWRVTLDGVALQPVSAASVGATWQQAYRLGPDAGLLRWQLPVPAQAIVFAIAQGVALLVLIVLALPALRPESRHPTASARHAALVPRTDLGLRAGTHAPPTASRATVEDRKVAR